MPFFKQKLAYAITEETQHRDLEGPSTSIPLSEMISSVLPSDKKDKLTELNNVSKLFILMFILLLFFFSW